MENINFFMYDYTKERKNCTRTPKPNSVQRRDGYNSKLILEGTKIILTLHKTTDTIGKMVYVCSSCKALKFLREEPSLCCANGRCVSLEAIPTPPPYIKDLLDNVENRISTAFVKNARTINNNVSFLSLTCSNTIENKISNSGVLLDGQVYQLFLGISEQVINKFIVDFSTINSFFDQETNMVFPKNTSDLNKEDIKDLTINIINILRSENPYVKDFKIMIERDYSNFTGGTIVLAAKSSSNIGRNNGNIYQDFSNLKEISILVGDEGKESHDDISIRKDGSLQQINNRNEHAMPLRFPLLFPYGNPKGWSIGLSPSGTRGSKKATDITPCEFYKYTIMQFANSENYLLKFGRLFQEYLCWAAVLVDDNNLHFYRFSQNKLRSEKYKTLIQRDEGERVGKRLVLPATFVGSARWYLKQIQNSLCIMRKYGNPTFFITFTTNPAWPEIKKYINPGMSAQDRPDIVSRVFKLKLEQLMRDIRYGEIFGKVCALIHTIEYQKRGLPHAHILVTIQEEDKCRSADELDDVICAEIPPGPSPECEPQENKQRELLRSIILENNIHHCNYQCKRDRVSDGVCTKGYPKDFLENSYLDEEEYYALYRRRKNEGQTFLYKKKVDNRMVVPYNPFLSLRYDCHINCEYSCSVKSAKYIYKYIHKGQPRQNIILNSGDEIQQHIDMRCVGSCDATWRLFKFKIHSQFPTIQNLPLHLENEQMVNFEEDSINPENIINQEDSINQEDRINLLPNVNSTKTELTEFFELNKHIIIQEHEFVTYLQCPEKFKYDAKERSWVKRKRITERFLTLGRLPLRT